MRGISKTVRWGQRASIRSTFQPPGLIGRHLAGMAAEGQSADPLNGFRADFALVVGAGFSDPDHAAAHGVERVLIHDNFDHWSRFKGKLPRSQKPLSRNRRRGRKAVSGFDLAYRCE